MLGLTYYLDTDAFTALLWVLAEHIPLGISLVFDYLADDENGFMDERNAKQVQLAREAGSQMRASYSFVEMESLLEATGFLAYEHLNAHAHRTHIFPTL